MRLVWVSINVSKNSSIMLKPPGNNETALTYMMKYTLRMAK